MSRDASTQPEHISSGEQARLYTVLIPARLSSTRLPNKPLADLNGVPMVIRVAQRALQHVQRRQRAVVQQHVLALRRGRPVAAAWCIGSKKSAAAASMQTFQPHF